MRDALELISFLGGLFTGLALIFGAIFVLYLTVSPRRKQKMADIFEMLEEDNVNGSN